MRSDGEQKRVAFISFRLGGTDGVSVVAAHWQRIFQRLGWKTTTVAGSGPVDRTVPGLGLGDTSAPRPEAVNEALADADLVVVENLLSIPLRIDASRVVITALRGRPALLHHHDPPWQRPEHAHITELPPEDQAWRHVTINRLTEQQFADRGVAATTIYNPFEINPPSGDRAATRARLGVSPETLLIAHPVRAIARKNIGAAIELTAALGGTYWLSGGAEDGYRPELERLVAAAPCPVLRDSSPVMPDLYAACDAVVFPSTWEGFGNPPVEASIQHKPVAVGDYPVAHELRQLGFDWFGCDDAEGLGSFLDDPDPDLLERNHEVARRHLAVEVIEHELKQLLDRAGW